MPFRSGDAVYEWLITAAGAIQCEYGATMSRYVTKPATTNNRALPGAMGPGG